MIYDHIIVGSGLAALGAAMATRPEEHVLVLAGNQEGQFNYYNSARTTPCAFDGCGGLGNAWHGVIPMNLQGALPISDVDAYASFLSKFYPGNIQSHLGKDCLFVPWAPVRPMVHWKTMQGTRGDRLRWIASTAQRIQTEGHLSVVHSAEGASFKAHQVWVAAGAVQTPFLLSRSFGQGLARSHISDHALCYVGLVEDGIAPSVTRHRQGVIFQAFYNDQRDTLYTRRPARFAYRNLDFGIEQRAVFGMPTGTAIAKIAKRLSPGLLAEAFFNKMGLFPRADLYSIYAQTVVEDAYLLQDSDQPLSVISDNIQAATQLARKQAPFTKLTPSKRNDLYIPGIHLHNSVHLEALHALSINTPGSSINVVDASVVRNIGPEHHSFKVMFGAYASVQRNRETRLSH